MARVVVITDDLTPTGPDGEVVKADESIAFALDGEDYEIDLSEGNADALRAVLSEYISAARRVGPTARRGSSSATKKTSGRTDLHEVRAWAQAQGLKVSDRGRVSGEVLAAYDQAHAVPVKVAAPTKQVEDQRPKLAAVPEVPQATFDDGGKAKKTKTG